MFKIDHRREVLASPYNGGHRALEAPIHSD